MQLTVLVGDLKCNFNFYKTMDLRKSKWFQKQSFSHWKNWNSINKSHDILHYLSSADLSINSIDCVNSQYFFNKFCPVEKSGWKNFDLKKAFMLKLKMQIDSC